jgi:hypothetical protein
MPMGVEGVSLATGVFKFLGPYRVLAFCSEYFIYKSTVFCLLLRIQVGLILIDPVLVKLLSVHAQRVVETVMKNSEM